MYIPKRFKQKHLLLGILLDNEFVRNNQRTIMAESISITIKDLALRLNVTDEEFQYITPELIRAEEIKCDDFGEGICVFPWNNAATSYYEMKYHIAGRKYFNDSVYDVVKWLLPIAIIVVSIFTTCTNIQLSKDRLYMQRQIDKIKQEMGIQKKLKPILPQAKKHPDSSFSLKK